MVSSRQFRQRSTRPGNPSPGWSACRRKRPGRSRCGPSMPRTCKQRSPTKERARHAANVQRLQQDIQDTQTQIAEDQQKVQDAAAGCFRGMAGSTEAQQEWDALVAEGQTELGDAPMSNSDLYSMLVRCVQTASGVTAPGSHLAPATTSTEAPAPIRADTSVPPSGNVAGQSQPIRTGPDSAPGFLSASPGPALRDPYMRSPGADPLLTGPELGVPSPIVHRNPAPTGLRPRTSVKQVVSGVAKTISARSEEARPHSFRRRWDRAGRGACSWVYPSQRTCRSPTTSTWTQTPT